MPLRLLRLLPAQPRSAWFRGRAKTELVSSSSSEDRDRAYKGADEETKSPERLGECLVSSDGERNESEALPLSLARFQNVFFSFPASISLKLFRPPRARRPGQSLNTMRHQSAPFIALALFFLFCCCCPSWSAAQSSGNSSSSNAKNALLLFASPPEAPSLREAPFRPPPGAPLRVVARLKPIDASAVQPNVRNERELSVVSFRSRARARLASPPPFFLSSSLSLSLSPLSTSTLDLLPPLEIVFAAGLSDLPRRLPRAPNDDPDAFPGIRPPCVRGRDTRRSAREGGAPPLGSDGGGGGGAPGLFSSSSSSSSSAVCPLPSPRRRLARHRRPRPRGTLQASPGRVVPGAQLLRGGRRRRRRRRRSRKRERGLALVWRRRGAAAARGRVPERDDVPRLAQAQAQGRVQKGVRHRGRRRQQRRQAGAEASVCVRGGRAWWRWAGGSDDLGRPRQSLGRKDVFEFFSSSSPVPFVRFRRLKMTHLPLFSLKFHLPKSVGTGIQQLREASSSVRGPAQRRKGEKRCRFGVFLEIWKF